MKGLVVGDKTARVANFHKNTIESFVELLGAAGLEHPAQLNRSHVYRRVFMNLVKTYEEIYPPVSEGAFLNTQNAAQEYIADLAKASAETF
jgi:hypothetical protein